MEKTNNTVLIKLVKDFYRGSLKICLELDLGDVSWDMQQSFLDATIYSELFKKFPVSSKFCKLYFKKLIERLEPMQEVHDDFYSYLCSMMQKEHEDYFSFRHYVVGNNLTNIITMKEMNQMVVNGTTGMRTWEAALMLSDWVLCNKEIFTKKKVLELGSGVGFTGVTIAKLCDIDSMMFTDCHLDVLMTITDNIKINFPTAHEDKTSGRTVFRHEQKTLEIMRLDWNDENFLADFEPDILIGADIVYDPTIIQSLCNTIDIISKRNSKMEIYIANVIRNPDTMKYFLETLGAMGFFYEIIPQVQCTYFHWDQDLEKHFIKINYK